MWGQEKLKYTCVFLCVQWGYLQDKDAAAGQSAKRHFKTVSQPPTTPSLLHTNTHWLWSDWTWQVISRVMQALISSNTHTRAHTEKHILTNTCHFCGRWDQSCSLFSRHHVVSSICLSLFFLSHAQRNTHTRAAHVIPSVTSLSQHNHHLRIESLSYSVTFHILVAASAHMLSLNGKWQIKHCLLIFFLFSYQCEGSK